MKKFLALMSVCCLGSMLFAEDNTLENYARSRISGPTHIKKNDDGSIKSMLIIGRAKFNNLLDDAEAETLGREDAEINASLRFSEFLNKNVSVSRTRSRATSTSSQNSEESGDTSRKASAEVVQVNTEEFASMSKAAIAGMREIYAGVFNNEYVIIYAWSKDECKQLQGVIMVMSETAQTAVKEAKDLESRSTAAPGSVQAPVESAKSTKEKKQRRSRNIKEGGMASADANEFL